MSAHKVTIGKSKSTSIIIIYYNNNRFRFWNGSSIGVNLKSGENATLLKAAFELKLREGWSIGEFKLENVECSVLDSSVGSNLFGLNALLKPTGSFSVDISKMELRF